MLLHPHSFSGIVLTGINSPVLEHVLSAHTVACDVVEDTVTEHRVQCLGSGNIPGLATDDDGQFRFGMGAAVVRTDAYGLFMPGQA